MSTVGTAVSSEPPPPPPPPRLFPPARPIGVVSDKIYPYFIASASADARLFPPPTQSPPSPARLRINYSISVHRALRARFCIRECSKRDRQNNHYHNGHYVIARYLTRKHARFCFIISGKYDIGKRRVRVGKSENAKKKC